MVTAIGTRETRRVYATNPFEEFTSDQVNQSIPSRFSLQVRRHASRLAVKTKTQSATYQELDAISSVVASAVLSRRVGGEEPVVLLLEKDVLLYAAILGVLKTGAFYVPLDPSYPLSRNEYILNDCQSRLILTDNENLQLAQRLSSGAAVLNVDELNMAGAHRESAPDAVISPDALAYIFYTSGSTGKPKGVMHTHRNVLHSIMKSTNAMHLCPDDRMSQVSSASVAASLTDVFGSLLNGAAVVPCDLTKEGIDGLITLLARERITIYHSVPFVYRSLVNSLTSPNQFPDVRFIRLAGEPIRIGDVESYKKYFSDDCLFYAGLGATELNVIRLYLIDKQLELADGIVPAGYHVADTEILLLDEDGRAVPPGAVGEIAIKSRYLPKGYWRQPELSATTFRQVSPDSDERIYHTGDVGYMLPGDCLVCLGRRDSMVKVRGHRVELAEIDVALNSLKEVKEAFVTAEPATAAMAISVSGPPIGPLGEPAPEGRAEEMAEEQNDEKVIEAYVVLQDGCTASPGDLRSALRELLPGFMIPLNLVILDEFPRMAGGKIDRLRVKQLSRAAAPSRADRAGPASPANEVQAKLLAIWERVLHRKTIGVKDGFFDIGGDSLAAIELIVEIEAAFGRVLPPSALLEAPTIELLAELLLGPKEHSSIVPFRTAGSLPPFFCVHAIGGDVISYRALADHMGADQPFYGLRARAELLDEFSVEDIAAHYITKMRRVQSEGPYHLGGYSFGGLVAFEMARQLAAAGARVGLLALFDTYAPGVRLLPFRRRLVIHLKRLFEISPSEKIRYVRNRVRINTIVARKRLAAISTRLREIVRREPANSSQTVEAAHHRASRSYVAQPYAGSLDLFRTTDTPEIRHPDFRTSWGSLATGGIRVHDVPGDHSSLITDPFVPILAQRLNECLRKARQ